MRKHKPVILLTLGFLVGICILLYPAFSDFWNSKIQSHAITDYESVLENLKPEDHTDIFDKANTYNKELYETDFPLRDYKKVSGYYDTLKINDNDMIGYLRIDRIGVGHLEGSSLPVGGENTHSVMSAHRGLPSSKLFTDLDRMEIGDTFQITVLDQVLTYRVDSIKTIEPNDLSNLQIIKGGDFCTLFTCTPYGINTHRLLVRGERIETIKEKPIIYVSNEAFRIEPMLVPPAVAAPMLLGLLIYLFVKYRKPPEKAKETIKEDGETENEA